jgi:hypothetical protein
MAETIADFFEQHSEGAEPGFSSDPWYNADGDCIHFHWAPDEFYREWVDDKLTVYRSIATGNAVGCQIKGVSALLKKLGDFDISLNEQDGTPLAIFLFVSQAMATNTENDAESRQKTYKYILEQVGKQKVEVAIVK